MQHSTKGALIVVVVVVVVVVLVALVVCTKWCPFMYGRDIRTDPYLGRIRSGRRRERLCQDRRPMHATRKGLIREGGDILYNRDMNFHLTLAHACSATIALLSRFVLQFSGWETGSLYFPSVQFSTSLQIFE